MGAAYLFIRSGASWTQDEQMLGSLASDSMFGLSVALSGDGNTMLIGAPGENSNMGGAYIFSLFNVYLPMILK